jgi:endonuclease YncB( thermonuclease family)
MLKNFLNNSPLLIIALLAFLGWQLLGDKNPKWTPESGKAPLSENWTVTNVADGDTITVRQTTGQEMKLRLACIDAPETPKPGKPGQPLGQEAKQKLSALVAAANNEVMVIPIEKDKYGRTVAEIMSRGKDGVEVSFQEEMLKSGMSFLYRQYAKNCPNVAAFEQAEKIAIASKAGVWSNPTLERPWEYRRRYK